MECLSSGEREEEEEQREVDGFDWGGDGREGCSEGLERD